ncbi:phosphoglycerate kinase [Saxibacter everestensis]|uniref:Phosphoglycerate kinase n=1 Tax=Saxibacter everestensis TaxID=2909229 RepID=A0ABY8QYQ4_9MICO|nr:phosphoglycerate kinase [Brevibacteriaceae bacterium ZFBP1038]
MSFLSDPAELKGKRVLVRSDLNVPLDGDKITDPGRINASAPTCKALADAGARVIVMAHLGRPKGESEPQFSLRPIVAPLAEAIGREVVFADDTVGESAQAAVAAMSDGDVVLLENLRFNPGETSKDGAERGAFADELARLADFYVSDGFGVVHRKQASVYDIAERLPHAAGGLVRSEVEVLQRLTSDPPRPYVVVLGGSKASDKLGVIDNLLERADALLIGGGMVFTFLAALGHKVGKSLLEDDQIETVRGYIDQAAKRGVDLVLPTDIVMASAFAADASHEVRPADDLEGSAAGAEALGLDIGPESAAGFARHIEAAHTVFWNGPMGVFEFDAFSAGTKAVAAACAELTKRADGSLCVIGGGDSAAAVRALGFADDDFGHISTGGGASLEYLEGKELPGLTVLEK